MVVTKKISFQTKGLCDIIDVTSQVEQQLAEAEINSGIVTLFISGSTAGISTILDGRTSSSHTASPQN